MSLKYAQIPAEDVIFREGFINNQYVADNGLTLTDVVMNNGGVFDGADSKADTGKDYIGTGDVSIEMLYYVNGYGEANTGYLVSNDQFVIVTNDTNDTLNVTSNFFGNSANAATDSIKAGNTYHIVVTRPATGDTTIYINGVVSGTPASSGTPVAGSTNMIIGNRSNQSRTADGTYQNFTVYNRVLTAEEVSDKYTQRTFKEPTPEQSEVWLPLRTYYNDGSNEITPSLGHVQTDECFWGTGAGVEGPTLLDNNGVSLDGANDHLEIGQSTEFNNVFEKDSPHSFSFLFRTTNTGVSVAFSKSDPAATYKGVAVNFSATGKIEYRAYENGTLTGLRAHTDTAWNDGQWHSATITYSGSEAEAGISFYVDGAKQAQTNDGLSGFTGSIVNTADMWIGEASYGGLNFDGSLKFPIVFPFELTLTQAKWLHDYMFRNFNL